MFQQPSHVCSVTDELWHHTLCWPEDEDTPTHAHTTPDGLLLPENEIPLTPPAEHNVLRFACVNESVLPLSEYSKNIVFSYFSASARLVLH